MRGGRGVSSALHQQAHKREFYSKPAPHIMKTSSSDHLPAFPRSTISPACWRAYVYLQRRLRNEFRAYVCQVITLVVDTDKTDWRHSKIWVSCNTLSRRRGHGLRHGVDRRASRSHSLERTWLDTSCAAPQTDHLQVNVAAEPLSVCSHRSMCVAVRAKGKRTSCCHSDLTYTSIYIYI